MSEIGDDEAVPPPLPEGEIPEEPIVEEGVRIVGPNDTDVDTTGQ